MLKQDFCVQQATLQPFFFLRFLLVSSNSFLTVLLAPSPPTQCFWYFPFPLLPFAFYCYATPSPLRFYFICTMFLQFTGLLFLLLLVLTSSLLSILLVSYSSFPLLLALFFSCSTLPFLCASYSSSLSVSFFSFFHLY